MPAERFYIDAELRDPSETVFLEGPELHHLAHVMRIRVGEEIELVNGRGALAKAKVTALSKHEATLIILSIAEIPVPAPHLILAIPFLRPSKLELVIEKCTELGTDAFWLYPADYSEKQDFSPHQWERLIHVAISAMKQSGRLDLPPIKRIDRFDELFNISYTLFFGDTRIAHYNSANFQSLTARSIIFISGPEKGFSEKEQKALDAHATGVRLHRNILRAETAPIAAACLFSDQYCPR